MSLTEADKNADRFAREVRIMARLSSRNLPRTIAGGLDGERPYLAMEYQPRERATICLEGISS